MNFSEEEKVFYILTNVTINNERALKGISWLGIIFSLCVIVACLLLIYKVVQKINEAKFHWLMISQLLINSLILVIFSALGLSLVEKTKKAHDQYSDTGEPSVIYGYFSSFEKIVYTNSFFSALFFVNSYYITLIFVLKYWLVAKKVTMINRKTEDKWLQQKVWAIFIFVTMCILALTIAYFAIFYGFDPIAAVAASPKGFSPLIEQLEKEAWCATIPSTLTILLLIQAIYLLKNNSGENSLSKTKVSILCLVSLSCIFTYILLATTFITKDI